MQFLVFIKILNCDKLFLYKKKEIIQLKNKFITAGIISAAVILSACSRNIEENQPVPSESTQETSTVSETVTEITEPEPPPMDISPITFNIMFAGISEPTFLDENILNEIEESTGVTLNIIYPDSEDLSEEISNMTASGSLPDMIYAGEYSESIISSGKAVPLNDYIEEYGENISELYGEDIELLKYSDGMIYTFGTISSENNLPIINGTFQIQAAVLKELGYPKINTLEDFEKCLSDYIELYPYINGHSTIGLSLCGGTREYWLTTVGNRINALAGVVDNSLFIPDENGKPVYKWVSSEAKEYFSMLNRLYNKGLLDEKSFTQKHDEYTEKLSKGYILAAADDYEIYSQANSALVESWKSDRTFFPLAVTLNEDSLSSELYFKNSSYENGIIITSECSDIIRAFRFIDWMCSPEAQILINWGIEGNDFEINDQGKRIKILNEETQGYTAYYAFPFPVHSCYETDPTGNYYTAACFDNYTKSSNAEKEVLDGYKIINAADLFTPKSLIENPKLINITEQSIPNNSEAGIINSSLETYIHTEIPNAIMCPEDEFEENWEVIINWLNQNGLERLNELAANM